ncbi:hypothetical protein N5C39_25025 [Enterobacter bugandensis]|uniref:Uncharacterized protein n=1 Tax=Enterobacter bugandensis TaxID=881260 RepID=A0AA42PVM0_9ENTR|nr:hypothetical protein [Enterobacter bugandensis]MDH1321604.1 hypothetical protein [Enterobacter bugandensis]
MNPFGYFPIYQDLEFPHTKQESEREYRTITIKNTTDEIFDFHFGEYLEHNGVPPNRKDIDTSAPNKDIFTTPPPHRIAPNATISYLFNPQFTHPSRIQYRSTATEGRHNIFDIVLWDKDAQLKGSGVLDYEFDVVSNYVTNHGAGCRNSFLTFGFSSKIGGNSSPDSLSITIYKHVWTSKLKFYEVDGDGHKTGKEFKNVKILANGKIEVVIPNLEKFDKSLLRVQPVAGTPPIWEALPNHYNCHSWGPEIQFPNLLTASNLLFHFEASGNGVTVDYRFATELA